MTISWTATTELDDVQHQLDNLASARSLDRLSSADELRYRKLCRTERALLQP